MTDAGLLMCGCGVSFLAVAGAYVALREGWSRDEPIPQGARRQQDPVALDTQSGNAPAVSAADRNLETQ